MSKQIVLTKYSLLQLRFLPFQYNAFITRNNDGGAGDIGGGNGADSSAGEYVNYESRIMFWDSSVVNSLTIISTFLKVS